MYPQPYIESYAILYTFSAIWFRKEQIMYISTRHVTRLALDLGVLLREVSNKDILHLKLSVFSKNSVFLKLLDMFHTYSVWIIYQLSILL